MFSISLTEENTINKYSKTPFFLKEKEKKYISMTTTDSSEIINHNETELKIIKNPKLGRLKENVFNSELQLNKLINIKNLEFPSEINQKKPISKQSKLQEIGKEIYLAPKKTNKLKWSEIENERFFESIKIWGTDFSLIQQTLFPNRSRNDLKRKFHLEEKKNPLKINSLFKRSHLPNELVPISTLIEENSDIVEKKRKIKSFENNCTNLVGRNEVSQETNEIINKIVVIVNEDIDKLRLSIL